MVAFVAIHVRRKSRDVLITGVSKKGVARSHGAVSDAPADGLLSSSLPTNSVLADSIVPTCALATLQDLVSTQQGLLTYILTTLPIPVLSEYALPAYAHTNLLIHELIESTSAAQARIARSIPVLTEHAYMAHSMTILPIHELTEHVLVAQARIGRPIDAFTEHLCTMPVLAARPILVPAAPAPHMRILLPNVLAGAWPRTYSEDQRPGFFTGIAALDREISSIPKAALTQVCAPRSMSSGKAAILSALLAQVTGREEVCALIDAGGCFNPDSAATAGVDLSRLLWVRCGTKMKAGCAEKSAAALDATLRSRAMADPHAMAGSHTAVASRSMTDRGATAHDQSMTDSRRTSGRGSTIASNRITKQDFRGADARRMQPVEQAFKAADILIQNGGFGLIAMDLGEIDERLIRKIPLTTWFRFARVIERQPTALVVFATYPAAQGCAALTLHIKSASARWHSGAHTHTQIFSGLTCEVELGKTRGRARKPAQSAKAGFAANPVWK